MAKKPRVGKLARQLRNHQGKWVAIVGDCVILADKSERKVELRAEKAGAEGALIRFVHYDY